ncbi:hypothetical protein MMC30_008147 [Trapelia coarctata]|nr:hypothetical protein [Trapelia coarctata]
MSGYDTDGDDRDSDDVSYDYEQKCGTCKRRFGSESAWSKHGSKKDSGCKEHKICFPSDENLDHAREKYHMKCFVNGCTSQYARGTWSDDDIVDHIKDEHTDWGSSSSSDSE